MKKFAPALLFLSVLCACTARHADINDVYSSGLLYLKSDNVPFTGVFTTDSYPGTVTYSYSNGIPHGKWELRKQAEVLGKGENFGSNILSGKALELVAHDTIDIDYWQEGNDESNDARKFLTVKILKPVSFFTSGQNGSDYANTLAPAVAKCTKDKKYGHLYIEFVSDFFKPRYYLKQKYEMSSGYPMIQPGEANYKM